MDDWERRETISTILYQVKGFGPQQLKCLMWQARVLVKLLEGIDTIELISKINIKNGKLPYKPVEQIQQFNCS